ncbi:protein-L-isoaspartate(D-aspartate) O-methyltransferase [Pseudoduganella namucuonensis]|uniref:Protein-L-isoaspartate O-methyltransferase n=1 Tax=Pseudoduganella namucuonensis TaxID=1035707 RepID=A0A1I7LBU4_9BURK|nr:protein-L-isoaspartate(D-aspartate) O-methyltransferase [Pseudoduganella namucuonensis]SFV07016.1 protein-L-isoaspartate(D-aspartate) O-methyltransferase [Pseudoduganella namucuonensis]
MTDKNRTFPLPLSSVVDKPQKKQPVFSPVATPQTATQNARSAAQGGYQAVRQAPAAPSRLHSHALERAQPVPAAAPRQNPLVSDAVRRAMVARVARQGVKDTVVLGALEAVPRHMFMDEALASQAYIDASLPIGHHQTISQPYIVARMIEVMRNGGQLRRVLEIGTGCGYQAAVLSCLAQEVYSIERIKPLHELAKANLRPLRVANLRLHYGDGMLGLPQAAPFDGIILAAAGMEVPPALLEQLAVGGRLVAPVGARTQHLQLVTRLGKAEWASQTLEDCHFVPLRPGTV